MNALSKLKRIDRTELQRGLKIVRDLAALVGVAGSAYAYSQDLRGKYYNYKHRHDYSVTINDQDVMFRKFMEWYVDQFDPREFRSWKAHTYTSTLGGGNGHWKSKREVRTSPSTYRSRTVMIEGHAIDVRLDAEKKETTEKESSNTISVTVNQETNWMLKAKDFEGYEAIVRLLDSFRAGMEEEEGIGVFQQSGSSIGNWAYIPGVPARHLDTIIIEDDVKQKIVDDIQTFIDNRERYEVLGIPWHRGYLFYGPPGTGKTSLVKALATEFNLDVYSMKPNDYDTESALERAIFSIPPRSILLLEDVDTAGIAKDREKEEKRKGPRIGNSVGAGALLNAIDGVATPSGLITIMTSNYPEKLDEALTRSGRIDMKVEVGYLNGDGLTQMIELAYGVNHTFDSSLIRADLVPSDVLDIIKTNMFDADTGIKMIEKFAYGD